MALGFSRAVSEYGSTVIIASNTPFKDLIAPSTDCLYQAQGSQIFPPILLDLIDRADKLSNI